MINGTNKKLYLAVEITQLLRKHNCTYKEANEILSLLNDEFKQQREDFEFESIDDYIKGNKTRNVENSVIQPLNHVEPYC